MVFIDTGHFVALLLPDDQWHPHTRPYDPSEGLVTSSLIINETISLLRARGYFSLALEFLMNVRLDPNLEIIYPDPPLQHQAWDEFKISGSFGANAVDCMSFVIMRNMRVNRAYTFDRAHFQAAGFETIP